MIVKIKALSVVEQNGVFEIELADRILPVETVRMLESLYPNLLDGAYGLLDKEALLSAIAKESDTLPKNKQAPTVAPEPYAAFPEVATRTHKK